MNTRVKSLYLHTRMIGLRGLNSCLISNNPATDYPHYPSNQREWRSHRPRPVCVNLTLTDLTCFMTLRETSQAFRKIPSHPIGPIADTMLGVRRKGTISGQSNVRPCNRKSIITMLQGDKLMQRQTLCSQQESCIPCLANCIAYQLMSIIPLAISM